MTSHRTSQPRSPQANDAALDRLAVLCRGIAPAAQGVMTPNGLRAAAELAAGDVVLTYDPDSLIAAPRQVLRHVELAPEPIWEIGLTPSTAVGAGRRGAPQVMRATRHHPFLTARGWRRVERLRPGDYALSADLDGEAMRLEVAYARPTGAVEPVFAIEAHDRAAVIVDRLIARGGAPSTMVSRLAAWLRPRASVGGVAAAQLNRRFV